MWVSSLDKFCLEPHVVMNETKALAAVFPHGIAYYVNLLLHAKRESPMEGAPQCQFNQV